MPLLASLKKRHPALKKKKKNPNGAIKLKMQWLPP
jgi:hypothetical protein